MNDNVLNGLKMEYQEIIGAIDSDFKEITEMEKSSCANMQRYKHLKELRDIISMYRFQGNQVYIKLKILDLCIKSCGIIEDTNDIYLLMYEGEIEIIERILGKEYVESSLGQYAKDKNNIAVYYIDIENPLKKIIVPIEKQDEFEKTHTVVIGKQTIYDCNDRYYNLRSEFFDTCIKQDQEQAVQLVLQKYKRKV